MLISTEWLKEFTEWPDNPAGLAARLTAAGITVAGWSGDPSAPVLELELTSNRPDCLGHLGVAREVATLWRAALREPAAELAFTPPTGLQVVIEAPDGCARYSMRLLELPAGAANQPAPSWMTARLTAVGQAPIHLLPDLSNYTMFEVGQPTHAFDADRLRGGVLRVRYALPGELLVTLDGVERQLDPADLVIADAERPVALAGVIGGQESAISPATRRVAIESAWFEPAIIRRAARRHSLRTEAGYRFERGADPLAAAKAAGLIAARAAELADARLVGGVDCVARPWQAPEIELRAGFLERLLGLAPPAKEIEQILTRLGFAAARADERAWRVRVPSWRADVNIEADLAEEVARVWGYDRFPSRLPSFQGTVQPARGIRLRASAGEKLRGRGYSETIALSFASAEDNARFAPGRTEIMMLNPLSEEESCLRASLVPSLLRLLLYNQNRDLETARLFEIGKSYARAADAPGPSADLLAAVVEDWRLALGGYGEAGGWHDHQTYDFFSLKGDVELVLSGFALPALVWQAASADWLHPGRSGEVWADDEYLGVAGEIHPDLAGNWKFRRPPLVAELHLGQLLSRGPAAPSFQPPSRYPAVRRDFSFVFDETVSWRKIESALAALRQPGWQGVSPLEVFRGGNIPAGQRSLLLRVTWQFADRTLRDEEVQRASEGLRSCLVALGGRQR